MKKSFEDSFNESFEQIYNKIYASCKASLQDVKNKNNKCMLVLILIMIVVNFVVYIHPTYKTGIGLSISISVCIFMIIAISANANYRRLYKQYVIQGIIKGYNEKYYYDAKLGVMKTEYLLSDFDRSFDEFYSEDRVYGKLENGENFQMSEVVTHVVERTRDDDGNVREDRTETFRGLYGIIRLQRNTLSEIHIKSNSNFRKYSKDRVEMESSEFEKYYDCMTVDKISTMRVFTSDLIEKYLEITKYYNNVIEVKISQDRIFFRFKTNQLFEPPMFTSGLSKELLKSYFRVIYYPIEIMKATIENINSVYE